MTPQETNERLGSTARTSSGYGVTLAGRLAAEIKQRWDQGEAPDVAAALAEHPDLRKYRSVVLDLAYTEYCRRKEDGEALDSREFSERFPSLQRSLYFMIEVQKLLSLDLGGKAVDDATPWPEPGEQFLGFLLISELGRGTFGRVFLASEPALGNRLVAVKIASKGHAEAEMLAKLRHANIVPVHSIQEEELSGLTAICMPYLGHTTLCDVLERAFAGGHPPRLARVIPELLHERREERELPAANADDRTLRSGLYVEGIVHFLAQLADALAYAHERGICHRDLKPSNVLLSGEGRPLLLDFNLSSDKSVGLCRVGGTLPYMAPEQLRALVSPEARADGQADPRSDLFSLGVIGYELLCGSLPFGAMSWKGSMEDIAQQLLERQTHGPEPIQAKNPQVDRQLAAVLEQCLAVAPERRPPTAAALAAAFRRQLAPSRRIVRRLREHRGGMWAIAALLLLATIGVGTWLAVRAPYSERRLQAGVAYAAHDQLDLALPALTEAIQADPRNPQGWFSRGRVYQQLGKYRQAYEDFEAAFQRAPTAETMAGSGYCLSKLKYHAEAAACYGSALSLGFRRAAIYNNLGYSLCQQNRLAEAASNLSQALTLDPQLPAAHRNLLSVLLNRAMQGEAVPVFSIGQVERAVAVCPPSAEFYRDAAVLCGMATKQDANLAPLAIKYLAASVAYGIDVESIRREKWFAPLRERPGYHAALAGAPTLRARSIKVDPLVDPLKP
jgi:serine/threonine protein kinase/Flp pilus assembly protein TadD